MSIRLCWFAALAISACATAPLSTNLRQETPAESGLPKNTLSLGYGARGAYSDQSDVGPVVALEFSSRGSDKLGWEAALSYSEHQEFFSLVNNDELDVVELSGGARYALADVAGRAQGFLPYVGAGLSALHLKGRGSETGAVGLYAHAGLNYLFHGGFTLGADLRGLLSSADELDYYVQFAVLAGWSF